MEEHSSANKRSYELKDYLNNISIEVTIEKQKGIRDVRVVKKYQECLLLYSIRMNQANIAHDQYNMIGFPSGILYLIKSRESKIPEFQAKVDAKGRCRK